LYSAYKSKESLILRDDVKTIRGNELVTSTNRKLHLGFPLVLKSVTLNGVMALTLHVIALNVLGFITCYVISVEARPIFSLRKT